jgi:predicted porin
MSNDRYGTLTLGRQYMPYFSLISPYSPTWYLTGWGAHVGNIDAIDTIYRANNSIVYLSPTIAGLTFSGSFSPAGVPGSVVAGATWSAALKYASGPAALMAGVERINNANTSGGAWGGSSSASNGGSQLGISAVNNGYVTNAAQQRIAILGGYRFTDRWDMTFALSNVQYIPGTASSYHDLAIFNSAGAVIHYNPTPAWDLAAGYSYTFATKANGIGDAARYSEFNLAEYYALSKRTGLYALQGFTRASGQTLGSKGAGDLINATATVGDGFQSTPSSSRSQVVASVGIVVRF